MEWTVKYAPKSMKDLVGNKSNYTRLYEWLKKYYDTKPSARKPDFKLITLLVGPPGIGKTSGIIALTKELKYELIEFNASDQRNEKVISRLVGRETKTHINQEYNGKVVLLDEVDGIQGREDKGGLAALMRVAKESIHPIICTANDPQSDKIKSLKKSPMTTTLAFKKPSDEEIAVLLRNIANLESLTVSDKLITVICTNAHGDIRGAVNDLENLSQERKEIPMNAIQALSVRDAEVSIDLALRQIFGEAKTLRQAQEVTSDLDVDYGMFMQYIVENIPSHSSYPSELSGMFSNAALADLFYGRIMTSQHWKYLKYYFYFLSAGVFSSKESPYKASYPKFPSNILILSKTKKVRAIRASVTLKFGQLYHCSKNKINNYSLPYIRLHFEKLFELYSSKSIDTPKGKELLLTVSSIHNEIPLEDEEFIYLFNDPMYEKQTAAEEKKQKALIQLIKDKADELRTEKILSRNKQLNPLGSFTLLTEEQKQESVEEKTVSNQKKAKTKKNSKKTSKQESVSFEETHKQEESLEASNPDSHDNIDTFDIDEKKPKTVKKSKRKESIPFTGEQFSISEIEQEKKIVEETKKEKQKSLFEFTNNKKVSSNKKKSDSKNLTDFL